MARRSDVPLLTTGGRKGSQVRRSLAGLVGLFVCLWAAVRGSSAAAAFVLLVDVTFEKEGDRDVALERWRPVARHCRENEPGTLSYEAALSDADPLRLVFVERYVDRDAYLKVHKSSKPFLEFRKFLTDLNPKIAGHSYLTSDIGYFAR
mmetsp:Transcript_32511/g.103667  ORF Transcript_32511/g.103667 Transcript_32511/m.103667 type:complete len:149 (-) Transcript_32511:184-630(-)